jgi:hypothetical protein
MEIKMNVKDSLSVRRDFTSSSSSSSHVAKMWKNNKIKYVFVSNTRASERKTRNFELLE